MSIFTPPSRVKQPKDEKETGVNVKVFVRCRPMSEGERKDNNNFSVISTRPESREIVVSQKHQNFSKTFTFDGVSTQTTSQEELFKQCVVPVIEEVLQVRRQDIHKKQSLS